MKEEALRIWKELSLSFHHQQEQKLFARSFVRSFVRSFALPISQSNVRDRRRNDPWAQIDEGNWKKLEEDTITFALHARPSSLPHTVSSLSPSLALRNNGSFAKLESARKFCFIRRTTTTTTTSTSEVMLSYHKLFGIDV